MVSPVLSGKDSTGPLGLKASGPTVVYWGYIGIMEEKLETSEMGYIGVILGIMKRKWNYYNGLAAIYALYWDNGKENGNYYNVL